MSQPSPHRLALNDHLGAHRLIALTALLALAATAAVVIALALAANSSTSVTERGPVPALRGDNGPEESGVAAAIGPRPTESLVSESRIAAAIGSSEDSGPAAAGPDESAVAAAISGR
jgi:hypothetical protein